MNKLLIIIFIFLIAATVPNTTSASLYNSVRETGEKAKESHSLTNERRRIINKMNLIHSSYAKEQIKSKRAFLYKQKQEKKSFEQEHAKLRSEFFKVKHSPDERQAFQRESYLKRQDFATKLKIERMQFIDEQKKQKILFLAGLTERKKQLFKTSDKNEYAEIEKKLESDFPQFISQK